jgi:hypothetical protein
MKSRAGATFTLALLLLGSSVATADAELGGSMASMRRQHQVAKQNDYTFLRTAAQVREFVRADRLEPLESNEHLLVNRVSFPYARPAVTLFVQRLAQQFHEATGERLVVTSLTRPLAHQPRNAHKLSVHPAGMAVDLRIPGDGAARQWLESALLQLEARGVLDATRERRPPHYHVAVFPERYTSYVERLMEREDIQVAGAAPGATDSVAATRASLDPAAGQESAHDDSAAAVPVVEAAGASATVPIAATLGVAGVALVGMLRRRFPRRGERRSRAR